MKRDKPALSAPIGADTTAQSDTSATPLTATGTEPPTTPPPAEAAEQPTAPAEEPRPDVLAPDDELIGGSWERQEDGSLVRRQED